MPLMAQQRWRFKLRSILLAVSLTVLVIPGGRHLHFSHL
jgi:hypothetical protein